MKNNGYIALMQSENYIWIGFGNTEEEAKKAIVRQWNKERKYCPYMEHATVNKFEEWYGFYTMEAINGKCETW